MREVVAIVAGVDGDGQSAGDDLVELHETRVIRIDHLRVGVDLEAVQAKLYCAFDLGFLVLEIGMHGAEADELGMRVRLLGDEIVDARHGMGRRGNRVDDEVRDGGGIRAGKQRLGCTGAAGAPVEHLDTVKCADCFDGSRCYFLWIDMRVCIDNCHGFSFNMKHPTPIMKFGEDKRRKVG